MAQRFLTITLFTIIWKISNKDLSLMNKFQRHSNKFEVSVIICFVKSKLAILSALLFELSTISNKIKYPWKNLRDLFGEWRIFHGKIIFSSRVRELGKRKISVICQQNVNKNSEIWKKWTKKSWKNSVINICGLKDSSGQANYILEIV